MNKNKGDAGNIAGFINLEHELTMENFTPNTKKIQPESRRETLLSKLPPLPERRPHSFDNTPSAVAVCAVCAGCNARLDLDDQIQTTFTGCRKCIGIYGRLDAAFDENAKRKKKEILTKMAGGSK